MNMESNSQLEHDAPVTNKEIGIHLAYMRNDIIEMKEMIALQGRNFASKEEHQALAERVKSIEGNLVWLVRVVVGGILLAILGFLGIKH